MSEIKRAHLIPLGPQKEQDTPSKEPRKTIRISIVLPESTEDTCPEYNYKDELAAAKKLGKHKKVGGAVNGLKRLEEFPDDDDDVKRIAREMEEKYGNGTSFNKKKKKGRRDDYADIGMGYDESDSFIDNTDGYDEMIPQNVTTLHGGFYINSGALEFKTDDEADSDMLSSSSDEDTAKKKISRKRILDSSDDTDRENKTEADGTVSLEKKRKLQNGGNGLQSSLKKKLLAQNKIYIKKRRPVDPLKKTVKELLREKREDLDMTIPDELDRTVDEDNKEKKNMSISNISDIIESVVKASIEEKKTPPENNTSATIVTNVILSSDGESSHENPTRTVMPEIKLPENLAPDILSVVTAIKRAAERSSLDGKNSFTSEINLLILRLERKSKCLGKPSKMKVYEHVSSFLKCKTETLIRRSKSLVLDDEQKKLNNLLTGLKSEIAKIMPALLECYEQESQRILQKKFSKETAENEENKNLRMPKRRFQWNDITKKQVKDILMLKKRCLLLEGKSKDVLDAQMSTFLKSDIQVLWPEGWMSMNALNKIYTTYADPKRMVASNGPIDNKNVTGSNSSCASSIASTAITAKTLPPKGFSSNSSSTCPITSTLTTVKNLPPKGFSSSPSSTSSVASTSTTMKNIPPKGFSSSPSSTSSVASTTTTMKNIPPKGFSSSPSSTSSVASTSTTMKNIPPKGFSSSPSSTSSVASTTTTMKNIPSKVFSNSNLSIIPVVTAPKSAISEVDKSSDISVNLSVKPLPEPLKTCDIRPPSPKKEVDSKLKIKSVSELLNPVSTPVNATNDDSVIVLDGSSRNEHFSPNKDKFHAKSDNSYCQVIDLSDKNDLKNKAEQKSYPKVDKTLSPMIPDSISQVTNKHHELSITPSFPNKVEPPKSKAANDDIQKVMEDLKVLQKMSSPKKTVEPAPTSSAVSVIAVNKSFAAKPVSNESSTMQRYDYKTDYNTSFQDEFQKQLFNALHYTPPGKSYNRYPHITTGGSNMVPGDKYYQNTNNNYTQSSNGHKSSTSAQQSGTYSILDDMFANFLTQYGYPKEATAPKSHQK